MLLQTVLFNKNLWSVDNASVWLVLHGYRAYDVDITENYFRFRQTDPIDGYYYSTTKDPKFDGISFVYMFKGDNPVKKNIDRIR